VLRVLFKVKVVVLYLAMVTALVYYSTNMVMPFLPVFLVSKWGLSLAFIGSLLAVAQVLSSMASVFSGILTDRGLESRIILGSMILLVLSYTLFSCMHVTVVNVILLLIVLNIVLSVIAPASFAIVVRSTSRGERGTAFGIYNTSYNLGLFIGPIVGGFLVYKYSLQLTTLLAILFLLTGLLIAKVKLGKYYKPTLQVRESDDTSMVSLREYFRVLIGYFDVVLFFSLTAVASGVMSVSLILSSLKSYFPSLPEYVIGLLSSLFFLLSWLLNLPGGVLGDRVGAHKVLSYSLLVISLISFMMSLIPDVYLVLVTILIALGVVSGLAEAPSQAFLSSRVSPRDIGKMFSIIDVLGGLSLALGMQIGGILASINIRLWTCTMGGLWVISLLCLIIILGKDRYF